jgi:hypothetical protein
VNADETEKEEKRKAPQIAQEIQNLSNAAKALTAKKIRLKNARNNGKATERALSEATSISYAL